MLGKGDAPNPLAVPLQNRHFLVNLRMPQADRVIHAGAGQRAAIGGKDEFVHRPGMPDELAQGPLPAEIPQDNRARLLRDSQ